MKPSGIGFKALPTMTEVNHGISVPGFRVLVLARELSNEVEIKMPGGGTRTFEIAKTDGGDLKRMDEAGSEGLLVAMGNQAGHERWPKLDDGSPDYAGGHPMIGDVILFPRYSGKHAEFEGADGRTYRMMSDEDVMGVRMHMRPPPKAGRLPPAARAAGEALVEAGKIECDTVGRKGSRAGVR